LPLFGKPFYIHTKSIYQKQNHALSCFIFHLLFNRSKKCN